MADMGMNGSSENISMNVWAGSENVGTSLEEVVQGGAAEVAQLCVYS